MEQTDKKIMFTGDSVTDCGRLRPLGDSITEIGEGYPKRVALSVWADHPGHDLRFQNSATSGDSTKKLLARFDTDVIAYHPDVLFLMIGINDCIHLYDENIVKREYQVPTEKSAENVEEMIKKCLSAGISPIIVSPLYFDLHKEGIRAARDKLAGFYREICKKYGIPYLDVQAAVDRYIRKIGSFMLSADRIHPKDVGTELIAHTILKSDVFRSLL